MHTGKSLSAGRHKYIDGRVLSGFPPRQRRLEFSRGFQPTVGALFFFVASATAEFNRR
jgi:hypothetical protein